MRTLVPRDSWSLLPHRSADAANSANHVVQLAVTMTDYWQLILPEKHRGRSSGASSPPVLPTEVGGVLGNKAPPSLQHLQRSLCNRMTFSSIIYIVIAFTSWNDQRGILYQAE